VLGVLRLPPPRLNGSDKRKKKLNAICGDLGMHYAGAYSAEMFDLLKEQEQKRLMFFWQDFIHAAEECRPTQRSYGSIGIGGFSYTPENAEREISTGGRKIVVIADAEEGDNLG
jgi:hypothetical protein